MILPLIALLLLLIALCGLHRIVAGPTAADRMLAVQLLGTTSVAILIVLALATGQTALFHVALVLAVLAAIALVTFVANTRRANTHKEGGA
jgi:multicomponent Na+:H+ antiporter subunit F